MSIIDSTASTDDVYDAIAKKHPHSNKAFLDGLSQTALISAIRAESINYIISDTEPDPSKYQIWYQPINQVKQKQEA